MFFSVLDGQFLNSAVVMDDGDLGLFEHIAHLTIHS